MSVELVPESAQEILASPAASKWLQEALRSALERDPVDALNDALALSEVLETRLRMVLGLIEAP